MNKQQYDTGFIKEEIPMTNSDSGEDDAKLLTCCSVKRQMNQTTEDDDEASSSAKCPKSDTAAVKTCILNDDVII